MHSLAPYVNLNHHASMPNPDLNPPSAKISSNDAIEPRFDHTATETDIQTQKCIVYHSTVSFKLRDTHHTPTKYCTFQQPL